MLSLLTVRFDIKYPSESNPFQLSQRFDISGPNIINYIHYKVWDETTYPFLNLNGATIDV